MLNIKNHYLWIILKMFPLEHFACISRQYRTLKLADYLTYKNKNMFSVLSNITFSYLGYGSYIYSSMSYYITKNTFT